MASEVGLSPIASAKGGKKSKKQTLNKEALEPTRVLSRRATS